MRCVNVRGTAAKSKYTHHLAKTKHTRLKSKLNEAVHTYRIQEPIHIFTNIMKQKKFNISNGIMGISPLSESEFGQHRYPMLILMVYIQLLDPLGPSVMSAVCLEFTCWVATLLIISS